ncbi:MAG TPA: saccharopine dehydrogenase NADP-binding domain-containing protein [Baekduia sp.]|uniref:saccharopine dehydrogenase family protein n=1 Tax=Baekduia sp. TaxID=2600305 RepID=UPI002D790FF6|nr:saccharopine dehydrogenase NADP-binding domain-containing protein [Baekduia sp.]HET6505277.1 saccharopine dehydrogenase NADP-binding domain-containing protein [Baekduia sp.]
MAERAYDVALLGATGFTGALTAAEIAGRAPAGFRWALAGRNRDKLAVARDRVLAAHPGAPAPELVVADVEDRASLHALAASTRVLTSTVGPYALHGEPVVAACAEHGTGYLDLTGEPEFADRMYAAHHARAVRTGARLIHACGFDSIPHDLGAQLAVEQLPEGVPLTVRGYVRAGGRISGGTFASALTGFSRPRQNVAAAKARRAAEPPRDPTRSIGPDAGRPHRARGYWAVPLPTIDPQVIARSARALPRYGPEFRYGHYAAVKRLPIAVGGAAGLAALVAAAQIGPVRRALLSRLPQGDGPTDAQMDAGWFTVTMVGEGGGRRVVCEVRGGDPGYRETSRMLADATLCLALDDLPETAGQVTAAQALGPALRERLIASGLAFDVVERH